MGKQWRNEDIIFPEDAQRWEDGVEQSLKENDQNAEDLKKHNEDKNNPHGVTAAQAGAYTKTETDSRDAAILQTAKAHTDSHESRKNNPHGVTASQVGAYTKTEADAKLTTGLAGKTNLRGYSNEIVTTISGADLNDLTETGTFMGTEMANAPSASWWFIVNMVHTNNYITQLAYVVAASSDRPRIRKKNNGIWGDWQTLMFSSDNAITATKLQSARTINGAGFDGTSNITVTAQPESIGLVNSQDLNAVIKRGFYHCRSNAVASTLQNSPTENAFNMLVLGEDGSTIQTQIISEYMVSAGSRTFIRKRYAVSSAPNGWGNWYTISVADGTLQTGLFAQTASKLNVSRKVAGVDFDGTADITIPAGNVGAYTKAETDFKVEKELKDLRIGARNLVPNSSFYSDDHGWAISPQLTATYTGAYTRVVKAAATSTRVTISRTDIDDRIKPNTEYTLGLMVYVESFSLEGSSSASTVFLRTNNGAMLDAPLGTIDWSKVGEWQLVTGTGTTRPDTWINQPQITIAIGENTICAFRIKEFGIVEGNRYLGWLPASEETALRRNLVETQQKVHNLEENTIRLRNHFPDHDFSKQTPRPLSDNGIEISYDSNGLVFNNPTQSRGRAYWGSPPLELMTGKTYNVSMYVNTGAASVRKEFIVGTSQGDNFSFSSSDSEPFWVHGTIGLTSWTGLSIWMEANTTLRIRELYVYEANTDITTARIERLEKDNSLPAIVPTFATGFNNYAASGDNFCQVVRHGDMVTIRGAITPTSVVSSGNTLNNFLMATLPVGYGPKHIERILMQGSGRGLYHFEITKDRRLLCSRYRGHNTGYTQDDIPVGSWLVTSMTYVGEDI
ncbi:pyocin knob domain-containing protein [Enterococcus casseliflavus]|uniref:pyocin knob domain-containing protein n=1 Tax=Enterococcus casseliflavus TaxID=37734 RepID=UPI0012E215E3|nr:pyocin knob domain-containing protein [Enterococcus casseliflavus]MUN75457.1 hypothetical protein [Enterococcus casseliflavus]MUN97114.1 hypothetical protein [Enterococcus casseliflavus]